jgi:PLP dependent protein
MLVKFCTSKLFVRFSIASRLMSFSVDSSLPDVVANGRFVLQQIEETALKCGRPSNCVTLVAVSKTKPVDSIQQLYDAGFRHFGENYFQELVEKSSQLPSDIHWHYIGHLQSSKASKLVKDVPSLFLVESVDSIKLAGKLNNACEAAGRTGNNSLNIFVQVDTSGEATKSGVENGVELSELLLFLKESCPHLSVKGLMTIGITSKF